MRTLEEQMTLFDANLADSHEPPVDVPGQGLWTRTAFVTFYQATGGRKGYRGIWALLDATAEQPGEWVRFSKVIQRAGHPEWVQRNAHKTLGAITKDIFGEPRWPVEGKQGRARHDNGVAEMIYKMDPAIAKWFLELEAHEDDDA